MAHNSTLVQSGTSLYAVSEDGSSVDLTEPSTVTLSATKPARFEVSRKWAVVVNTTTQPLIVDDSGIVLFLSPLAPTAAPTLAASSGAGGLTGTFQVKYTFAIRDLDANLVAESGFSASASVTITEKKINVSSIQTMPGLTAANYNARYEIVRRFYRTAAGGSAYFLWYTIGDNTTTTFEDDTSDAAIAATAANALGTVSFLSHIGSFRDRLFGLDDSTNRERLLYSEAGLPWAWPTANFFDMPQIKGDSQSGITAIIPRKEGLGLAKSNMLLQLTGSSDDDFRVVVLSSTVGAVNQETVASYRDDVYFLGQDGVYRWSENGLTCISDEGNVRSWFTTDDYFDRAEFVNAVGVIDPINQIYRLALTRTGQTEMDTWVSYDIIKGVWWGPHRTSAFAITAPVTVSKHSPTVAFGSDDGFVAIDTDTRADYGTVAIETNGTLAPIRAVDPPFHTYFGTLTTEIAPQSAGNLYIYPSVGEPDAVESPNFTHPLNTASVSVGRIGYGRFFWLRFYHNTLSQLVSILGFEVEPVNIVGRRR